MALRMARDGIGARMALTSLLRRKDAIVGGVAAID
jgi:hypothetical protein